MSGDARYDQDGIECTRYSSFLCKREILLLLLLPHVYGHCSLFNKKRPRRLAFQWNSRVARALHLEHVFILLTFIVGAHHAKSNRAISLGNKSPVYFWSAHFLPRAYILWIFVGIDSWVTFISSPIIHPRIKLPDCNKCR